MTLEVKELGCKRGGREVFAGLDFQLSPGELLVVTGPNGSGKSSLLRMLAGFLRPTAGSITWDGEPVLEDREAHGGRSAYVGHLDAVKPVMTVEENLEFWSQFEGALVGEGRVRAALERVDLVPQTDLPAGFLSAGQKRRLNLARLVARPAALWLLDEPTSALDDKSSQIVATMIEEHCQEGGMAIAATHLDLGIDAQRSLDIDAYRPRVQLEVVS